MLSLHDALPICPWRDLTYFCIGSLTIEERRQSLRDLIAHYRQHLVATGATNVIDLDEIWEQVRRWVMYGIQAWAANMDHWGRSEEHTSELPSLMRISYAVFCLTQKKQTR